MALNPDPLYRVEDAAAYLGVTARWLYDHYRSDGIPVHRIGGGLRFRRSGLDLWIDQCRVAA